MRKRQNQDQKEIEQGQEGDKTRTKRRQNKKKKETGLGQEGDRTRMRQDKIKKGDRTRTRTGRSLCILYLPQILETFHLEFPAGLYNWHSVHLRLYPGLYILKYSSTVHCDKYL